MQKPRQSLLVTLLLIIFIDSLSYFVIIPVLLRLLDPSGNGMFSTNLSMEMRNITYGIIMGLLPLAYLLFAPIIGRYSDHLGRKVVLGFCLALTAVSFAIAILAISLQSISLLLISRFFSGVGASSQPIAWASITDLCLQEHKARYLSWAALAMTLAMMLGPLMGAYLSNIHLSHWFTNQTPFLVALIFIAVNLFLLKVSFQETYQPKRVIMDDLWRQGWQGLLQAIHDKRIRLILSIFLMYEFVWSLYFQDISLFLKLSNQYSPEQCSQFISWISIWMLFGLTAIYSFIIRHVHLNLLIMGSLFIMTLGLLSSAIVQIPIMQWLSAIPIAITVGIAYPSLLAVLSNRVCSHEQGLIMGLAASMLSLAWVGSAFLIGPLTNAAIHLPLQIAAIGAGIAMVLFIIHLRREQIK